MNYRRVQGILKKTGFNKLNAHLDLTQYALNHHAVFRFHLSTRSVNRQLGFPEAFRYAVNMNPTAPVMDPNNTLYGGYFQQNLTRAYNPVSIIDQNINTSKGLNLSGDLSGEYDFSNYIPGLSINALYSHRQGLTNNNYFSPSTAKINGFNHHGWASKHNSNYVNWLAQTTLHYQRTVFKNLNFNILGGYSYQDFVNSSTSVAGGNFLSNDFSFNNLSAARDFNNGLGIIGSYKAEHKLIAYFGRINLNFLDTYYLMASIRREGSSRFGKNERWGNFPAISGGIEVTRLVSIPYVNSLKVRAGYGITGQDAPGDYLSESLLGPHGYFLVNGQYIPSYGPTSNANPNLKWETKYGLDIGLDFRMFHNKLSGSFDYYHNTTKDLIYNATVPVPPNLSSHEWINVGKLASAGFEANITAYIIRKQNFFWQSNATFSLYKRTRLVSLSNKQFDFGKTQNIDVLGVPGMVNVLLIHLAEGQPIGQIWGPVYEGIKNGKWVFKDLNGDGKINQKDDTVIGNGLPKWSFGFSNTIRYKNWNFSFNVVGVFGHDLVNTYRAFYQDPTEIAGYNVLESTLQIEQLTEAHKFSSFFVENASYVRLNNATLGYTLPIKHILVSQAEVYLSGRNLFTITRYTGADPSVRYSDGGNLLAPGIDRRNTWFSARMFTLGLNLTF
ncbi:MAG: TonB-dependent receptor [Chlorobi bacterium]|nr:TonB-dependent receptor [Chlorobiota bacterium]